MARHLKRTSIFTLGTLISLFFFTYAALAQIPTDERIVSYSSHITVNTDRSLLVTETISVTAIGDKIKRGIYRDFPTLYGGIWGMKTKIPFKVISVTRDGKPEPFRSENQMNGVRVYAGESNVFLTPGRYTYTITYSVDRQIGYFEDHDELYYNITGNGWDFPIDTASATIVLPAGIAANAIKTESYTGVSGSKTSDAVSNVRITNGKPEAYFETTQPLNAQEGLTVVVGWPKGFIPEPTQSEKLSSSIRDNIGIFGCATVTIILFLYYIYVWIKYGRDPKGRTIIPRFDPPEETLSAVPGQKFLSPAVVRYIDRMGYDDKCITTSVVDGAIKGLYKIEQKKNEFNIQKLTPEKATSIPEEIKILNNELFTKHIDVFLFDQVNHVAIQHAQTKLKDYLKTKTHDTYFMHNRWYVILAAVVSSLLLFFSALVSGIPIALALPVILWLTIWTIGVAGLLKQIHSNFRSGKILPAIFLVIFSVPFLLGEIVGIGVFAWLISLSLALILVTQIILHVLFYFAMKVRTKLGREIQDQIEGLKMFLTLTEQRRYEMLHKTVPDTISMYEKYLPYAVALDIEPQWSKLFDEVIKAITPEKQAVAYSPTWYHGSSHFNSMSSFSNQIGSSFTGSISSSSVAPGSRSGFSGGGGGGGSSGGGGGGGGGGGW